jgi:acyl dehydratase
MTAIDNDPSLFYEDLDVGLIRTSPARTVTETDLVTFCMLSGDWNPIHSDEEFSRGTDYGRRVVHGLFGMAVLTGLMDRAGWFSTSAMAMLGIKEWEFRAPIFVGDTIHCQMEITALRLTSRGDKGVADRRFRLVNQRGEVIQEGDIPLMVRVRGATG